MYVCMYVCMYFFKHAPLQRSNTTCCDTFVFLFRYRGCIYVRIYIYVRVCLRMIVCMYVYVYTYVCVYFIYLFIYNMLHYKVILHALVFL